MYWRIRKIGPNEIARKYGIHAFLVVSVLINILLFTKVNASKALSNTVKLDFEKFARQVTDHLFDANYLTFSESMNALPLELGPGPMAALMQRGDVPRNLEELKAINRELSDSKPVGCIHFDSVYVGSPDSSGMLPVDVKVRIAVHDAQGVKSTGMAIKYLMGTAFNKKTNESRPIVVNMSVTPIADTAPTVN